MSAGGYTTKALPIATPGTDPIPDSVICVSVLFIFFVRLGSFVSVASSPVASACAISPPNWAVNVMRNASSESSKQRCSFFCATTTP